MIPGGGAAVEWIGFSRLGGGLQQGRSNEHRLYVRVVVRFIGFRRWIQACLTLMECSSSLV